ncbi:MAG TPA: hypothetical protein VN643_09385, partial [Pyrinomonadaceae bacterium]|nr:hypothetical protein [Pyrinomonadaceae bacterium]
TPQGITQGFASLTLKALASSPARRHESSQSSTRERLQRSPISLVPFPGALPQAGICQRLRRSTTDVD